MGGAAFHVEVLFGVSLSTSAVHAVPSYIPCAGNWERAGGALGTSEPNFGHFSFKRSLRRLTLGE